MAVQEDDLGSEQTLGKILELMNAIWENCLGTTKDKNHHITWQLYTSHHYQSMEVNQNDNQASLFH